MSLFIKEILLTEAQIQAKVQQLGEEITMNYGEEEVIVICILKGAMIFTADLIRQIKSPVILDSMIVSSYGGSTESSGEVKIIQDTKCALAGKHVLVVDDIIDTGNTLNLLMKQLQLRQPKSLKSCTFLNKPSRRLVDFVPDYIGYDIPDEFVIGYGLDYDSKYRALPFVAVISPDAVQ